MPAFLTQRCKDQHTDSCYLAKGQLGKIPRLRNGAEIKARASPVPLDQIGVGAGVWPLGHGPKPRW